MEKKKYYITTAIAYASGKPHIGNTYEIVLADAIARFRRAQGYDVFFQTGTDEHGQKIELKAVEKGVTPKEFVDDAAGEIKRIWDLMNTSYDKFIRTTDDYHERQIQKVFRKLYEQGDMKDLAAYLTKTPRTTGKLRETHYWTSGNMPIPEPEKKVIRAYDVWKEKKNYGKVSMGVVRTTYLIDENGIIIKAFDKVKAADNPAQMLGELE